MKVALDGPIDLDRIVVAICENKDTWQVVNIFAQSVMGRKEEDEHLEKQRKRREERQGKARESDGRRGRDQNIDWDTDVGSDLDLVMDEE